MKFLICFAPLLFAFSIPCYSQQPNNAQDNPLLYFLPKITDKAHFATHTAFAVQYSPTAKDPLWVSYSLSEAQAEAKLTRKDNFRADPAIAGGTATLEDYKHSGFDRGHMAPAADFRWNEQAADESFLLSNICPQNPALNRGMWSKLEAKVRKWAIQHKTLYIVTGPVFSEGAEKIGQSKVWVPIGFFKVILDYNTKDFQAIGFLMQNSEPPEGVLIQNYAVKIDSIEKITGIQFFAALPDSIDRRIDTTLLPQHWFFKHNL